MRPHVWKLRGIWFMTCGACIVAREYDAWVPALCAALRHVCEPLEVTG